MLEGHLRPRGGVTVRRIALFDGEVWNELAGGTNGAVDVMVVDNQSIFAAGNFDIAGVTPSFGLARWSQTVASVTGHGFLEPASATISVTPPVLPVRVFDTLPARGSQTFTPVSGAECPVTSCRPA